MHSLGTVLQGRYRIERLLGHGGMSTVFLATHLRLQRPVAMKVLQPLSARPDEQRAFAEQLEGEARIMAGLSHPNLALVLDFFDEGGLPHLIMEFIEGRNLDQVAELAPKVLSQRRVLEWTDQLLQVLDYLHGRPQPVIVRDLKPGNIMMDAGGRLRLIDFGLAKRIGEGGGTRPVVRGMGSQGFAPIEQYGRGVTDQRSDLYALGATMLFLLTKQAPPEAAERLSRGTPLPDPRAVNPSVTPIVWECIQSMLALYAKDRPPSAHEVRRRLGLVPIETGLKPAPAPPSSTPSAPTAARPPASAATAAPGGAAASHPQPIFRPRPQGRTCPVCQLSLRARRQGTVEVDVCERCRGMWLDRGELEQLVELAVLGNKGRKRTLWESLTDLI